MCASMKTLFPGYYRPTELEFDLLAEHGIIVLDANVLLKLYQFSPATRTSFLNLLEQLKSKLWLPHQAAFEYQKNREKKIADQLKTYDFERLTAELQKYRGSLISLKHHPLLNYEGLVRNVDNCLKNIREEFQSSGAVEAYQQNCEQVRVTVDDLFEERVGLPYPDDRYSELSKQCDVRFAKKIPPGFMDLDKTENRFGDAILWFQILDFAQDKRKPIVFVTDDKKEDWWTKIDGQTKGPRPELVAEIRDRSGQPFCMYDAEQFLTHSHRFVSTSFSFEDMSAAIKEVADLSKLEQRESAQRNDELWRDTLEVLMGKHIPTYSILSTHVVKWKFADDNNLTIWVRRENFQKMIEGKVPHIVAAYKAQFGKDLKVIVEVNSDGDLGS